MNITHRDITFEGFFSEKDIQLLEFKGKEQFSDLFEFKLVVNCKSLLSQPEKIIGQSLTVQWKVSQNQKRFFNGIIKKFAYAEEGTRFVYYITLSPKLWLLKFRKNSRIFSEKYSSVVDIIKQLLKEHQIEYQLKLNSNYAKNEYCVQYQETDFDFLTRLLENAGIFYYFKQENHKHILILSDNKQLYKDFSPEKGARLHEWYVNYHFYPNKYTVSDHDFKQPQKKLLASREIKNPISGGMSYEIFDYPGNYEINSQGSDIASLRLSENTMRQISGFGKSNYSLLQLCDCLSLDKQKKYVITALHHEIQCAENNRENFIYENTFDAIPSEAVYKPPRKTLKPKAPSSQLAVVVGPSGEDIYTDQYGRLKVQFYWDREGKSNEKSSCWMRCIQQWEGVLRVGTPVLIGFIDADVDNPIILGPIHDGKLMPLYELEAQKTKSSFKRRNINKSAEKTYNEIYFEDKKGQQNLFVYASKDMSTVVENNYTLKIKGNMNIEVDGKINIKSKGNMNLQSTSGDIQQEALNIQQKASVEIKSKASMQSIESSGILTLKGAMIKEN